MPCSTDKQSMLERLDAIETAMRGLGLWSLEPPSAEALASQTPFAADTMPLQMWLQWIFLPRMRETIRLGLRPPAACNIHPFAAHSFVSHGLAARPLVAAIRAFDEAFAAWVKAI
ncbi:YqcC family protein [Thiofaba sp. EF100]|uniref:YqcC family protein n=1 Tax=Thiofaba sp. EF100 TaxID=3121274 RepID=UPI003221E90E